MSTYKVIQDIEAEDKLVGPLTLRQFIYAGIGALSGYLGFLTATKGAPFMLAVFLPITFVFGFFAFPWRQDQPTEVWALAKLRFYLKPRRRKWDQSGTRELVTVTAPKVVERHLTDGLGKDEVNSRLNALASTLDSRGWAIKNVNVNIDTSSMLSPVSDASDRLVEASSMPQEVSAIDVNASDDILDERANPVAQHFDTMINAADTAHRQQLIAQLASPNPTAMLPKPASAPYPSPQAQPDYWFMNGPAPTVNQPGQAMFGNDPVITPGAKPQPQAAATAADPTPDEEALVHKLKEENASSSMTAAYGHMKTLKTPEQLAEEARKAVAEAAANPPKQAVTPSNQAAIINLANNDDLDVATIARQASKEVSRNDEVVISLR